MRTNRDRVPTVTPEKKTELAPAVGILSPHGQLVSQPTARGFLTKGEMKIHPTAELLPMLSPYGLRELADDILENGLQQPIVMQGNTLLDGRNRLAACKLAGVEVTRTEYKGNNPQAYIVSANFKRRHLTREQRDEFIHGLREQGMTLTKIAKAVGVGQGTVQRAVETALPNGKGEVMGADGKNYPAHYAPRAEKPHVAQATGDNEWYTPKPYIDAAQSVMGEIELDPASMEAANKIVKAKRFHTQGDNGLKQDWKAKTLFLNPPYASELVGKFIEKLAVSVESKHVQEAIVLVNNATETKWFARLAGVSSFLCFPASRVKFWKPDSTKAAPLQGQCVAYIGKNGKRFCKEFNTFGLIVEVVR